MNLKLILALVSIAVSVACTNQDATYEVLAGAGRLPCNRATYVVAPSGDFSYAQQVDIASAVGEISRISGLPLVWFGEVPYRPKTNPHTDNVIVQRADVVDPNGIRRPGWTRVPRADGSKGVVSIDPSQDVLPSPTAPSFNSGNTFRGLILHELMHIVGLRDMYDHDGGHPGLLMGFGQRKFNTLALGDQLGAKARGCN